MEEKKNVSRETLKLKDNRIEFIIMARNSGKRAYYEELKRKERDERNR